MCALLLPATPAGRAKHLKQRRPLLALEFRTFQQAFIEIPARSSDTLGAFFRLADAL